jgi:hypothetical protein
MAGCSKTPAVCLRKDIGPKLSGGEPQKAKSWQWTAKCPVCGAAGKLNISPGTQGPFPPRFIWHCAARKCDPGQIREQLLITISSMCLGTYGRNRPARPAEPAAAQQELSALRDAIDAVLSDSKIRAPADLRLRIAECLWGEAPGDWDAFLAFAERAGVQRSKRYEAAAAWGRLRRG